MTLLINAFVIVVMIFATWGLIRTLLVDSRLRILQKQEFDNIYTSLIAERQAYTVLRIDLDRERFLRRSFEEHYADCARQLKNCGCTMSRYISPLPTRHDRITVIDTLCEHYNLDELSLLLSKLGIPFDRIKHGTLTVAANDFVWYMERRG